MNDLTAAIFAAVFLVSLHSPAGAVEIVVFLIFPLCVPL
jgi:hypothetical protein